MEPPPGPAWTRAEDKAFEAALLTFPDQTPGRWRRIAREVPGKSPEEMEKHFDALVDDVIAISSGLVPLPVYNDEPKQVKTDVMKKKGKAWSEEEHLLFLEGLKRYGKGDWRGISRNIVKTKTATQVASHAQKYFNRQNVKNKGRRTSIHDLTPLDVLNPVDNSSLMQNSFQDNSIGYDNITNMNSNQEGMLVTNNNSISPPSQYRGSLQGHNNSNSGEIHLQNHLSFGKTSIPEHLSSSPARSFNHDGVLVNGHPSDMYYQGGVPKYENFTMPRNKLSVSTPNQFTIDNNGNILDMNGHLISPQSLYSPKGIPMGYYDTNMIGQSTPPPPHLQRMNGHMGPHLPSSQTIHTPHRSLYMGHDDTNVGSHGGASDNQMKGNEAEGFNSLPDQSPNAPKKAHLQRMNGHMGPHLPSSQTIHTPHRSLYMGHDDTKVGSHGGVSDNQMKGNEAEGFNSLPDQSPNAPKKAKFRSCSDF